MSRSGQLQTLTEVVDHDELSTAQKTMTTLVRTLERLKQKQANNPQRELAEVDLPFSGLKSRDNGREQSGFEELNILA